ncbi:hypothetical protein Hanom_Chr12g01123241 [Helianthus anomalus]
MSLPELLMHCTSNKVEYITWCWCWCWCWCTPCWSTSWCTC